MSTLKGLGQMTLLEVLPRNLHKSAYIYNEEAAWKSSDAIDVINYLTKIDKTVSGIEVWLPASLGPTIPSPFIYTWDSGEIKENESWETFVQRTNEQAIKYIELFQWDSNDDAHKECLPYFNIDGISKEEWFEE